MSFPYHFDFFELDENLSLARQRLSSDGAILIANCFEPPETDTMKSMVRAIPQGQVKGSIAGSAFAARNLLNLTSFRELAESPVLKKIAQLALGQDCLPVKGTLFDKNAEANWLVPWHQDLTIAVESRVDLPGYGPWSTKAGIVNVQPPVAILEELIAIRIHLDPSNRETGAIHLIPGSHQHGKLASSQVSEITQNQKGQMCRANSGDVLLMRPLLLHRSLPGTAPLNRRTIHFEFASAKLPSPLNWAYGLGIK